MEIKRRKVAVWLWGGTAVIVLVLLNAIGGKFNTRLDLTDRQQYTLSPATRKLLKNLEDIVTIRVYFSQSLPPAVQSLKTDVDDLLSEFKIASGGNLRVEFHDPQTDAMTEQKVMLMGIPPLDVNIIKKDKQEIAKIYLGMSLHFTDRSEVLAVVQDTRNLEYRLAAGILKMTQKTTPTIGWCDAAHEEDPYRYVQERIAERYEIRKLTLGDLGNLEKEPVAALVLIPPEKLSDKELAAIDRYLKNGGKLVLMAEEVGLDLKSGLQTKDVANPLADLLQGYGVTIDNALTLDRSSAHATFSTGYGNLFTPYPYWIQVRPENFNAGEPMVSELATLVIPWAGPIRIADTLPEKTTVLPLVETTEFAVAESFREDLNLDPNSAKESLGQQSATKKIPLSVLITRKNGVGTRGAGTSGTGTPDTKILVFASRHFLQDHFLQRYRENSLLIENTVDVFASGDTLVGIRSKTSHFNPIELESESGRTWVKTLNLLLSPSLLLAAGSILWFRRKARALQLQKEFLLQ